MLDFKEIPSTEIPCQTIEQNNDGSVAAVVDDVVCFLSYTVMLFV